MNVRIQTFGEFEQDTKGLQLHAFADHILRGHDRDSGAGEGAAGPAGSLRCRERQVHRRQGKVCGNCLFIDISFPGPKRGRRFGRGLGGLGYA